MVKPDSEFFSRAQDDLWADIYFPPINLYNAPKHVDYYEDIDDYRRTVEE